MGHLMKEYPWAEKRPRGGSVGLVSLKKEVGVASGVEVGKAAGGRV